MWGCCVDFWALFSIKGKKFKMNIEVINEVMSNRIKLISCLFKAIKYIRVSKDQPSSVIDQVEKMKAVVKVIQSNFENHTVAFSTDEDFKVSYARSPEDVFNSNKQFKEFL
jgi:hypothetical protein